MDKSSYITNINRLWVVPPVSVLAGGGMCMHVSILIPVSAMGTSAVFAEFLALSEVLFSSSSVLALNRNLVWSLSQNIPPSSSYLPRLLCWIFPPLRRKSKNKPLIVLYTIRSLYIFFLFEDNNLNLHFQNHLPSFCTDLWSFFLRVNHSPGPSCRYIC